MLLTGLALLSACGLPRSGPTRGEIISGTTTKGGEAFIVEVTDEVNRATALPSSLGFSREFLSAGRVSPDMIRPGDTLSLAIWENVEQGLFPTGGQGAAVLDDMQVDSDGFIFVPFAGRIRASGNTPDQLRVAITEELSTQTPDPQVQVRRVAGDGATVTVSGSVGGQGIYPLERPNRTLTEMLAQAGGITIDSEIAVIRVLRRGRSGSVWYQDLYRNPANDIALRAGDRIMVEGDTRSYTALGAARTQTRVLFTKHEVSALEALAQVGGLSSSLADPKGIFVFRDENDAVANAVLGRGDLSGPQRVVYVMDITQPNGVFMARDFMIRDGDTIYVTEAPYVQWTKTIGAITGSLYTANTIEALTVGN
ncbi:MAG: polysaccharide biosynthesis/export family protein [Rhodobacteraceae bacterium]|nr:polysaccharide biosynthesis/export family protein [Paracoccaceae bacterium]